MVNDRANTNNLHDEQSPRHSKNALKANISLDSTPKYKDLRVKDKMDNYQTIQTVKKLNK